MVIAARFIDLRSDANIGWPKQFRSIQTDLICGQDMSGSARKRKPELPAHLTFV